MMSLGETFLQQCIVDRAWERNVQGAVRVKVASFGVANTKFDSAEAMWVNGNLRPGRNFGLELL